jgi:hypothetical protein
MLTEMEIVRRLPPVPQSSVQNRSRSRHPKGSRFVSYAGFVMLDALCLLLWAS